MTDRRPTTLRFAVGAAAWHSLIGGGFTATFLWIAREFALDEVHPPASTYSRSRWLYDLGNTAHGRTGSVICLALALFCGWWLVRATWRFGTRASAAAWDGRLLRFHSSYGAGIAVTLDRIESIHLYQEVKPSLFGLSPPIDTLRFRFAAGEGRLRRRQVKIRSNTIEGGRAALERLEAALADKRRG